MGIRVLARRIIDKMAELARHRAEIADLPEQPFQALLPATTALRHELPSPLGQVDQDGTRLEHGHRPATDVVIDDRRHAVVGADREEIGLELVAAADIDRDHAILEAALLEHDGDLPAVRRRPIVEVDHELISSRKLACHSEGRSNGAISA